MSRRKRPPPGCMDGFYPQGGRRQGHEVGLHSRRGAEVALKEQPDLGREPIGPASRGPASRATRRSAPPMDDSSPLRHDTRRHARAGNAAAMARTASGRRVVDELESRGVAAAPRSPWRDRHARGPTKDGQRRRDAERIGQLQAMQGPTERRVVAKFGIAQHRGDLKARRPDLPEQGERQTATSPGTATTPESARAAAPRASATPRACTRRPPRSTRAPRSTAPP